MSRPPPSRGSCTQEVAGISPALIRKLELRRGGKLRTERALAQDKGHKAGVAAFIASITTGKAAVSPADLAATSRATFAAAEALRGGDAVPIEVG